MNFKLSCIDYAHTLHVSTVMLLYIHDQSQHNGGSSFTDSVK